MRLLKPPRPDPAGATGKARRVLALCGDTQVGLWMVRSLARNGLKVFAVCRGPSGQAAHSRYSAGAWMIESGPREASFVAEVERLARRLDVGSVMTISEGYHNALIGARDRFEPDIHLFSPSRECFDKATDKEFMHALCLRLGVPVAKGTTLEKLLAAGGEGLRFPVVLRTSRQNVPGARAPWKAGYAEDIQELLRLYDALRDRAGNVLVQEYHPGAEDHVQVLMHRGEPFMVGEYIGEHHMPLAGGVTVQRVTCRHERLIRDAVRLLKAIGWEGIAGVQFHYDPRTGRYIFMEINPRFIGGLPTLIMAGFEAPFLLWQSHFEPERMRAGRFQLGLRTRILGGAANWMLGMIRGDRLPPGQKRPGRASVVARFLWNCGPWTRDDTFCLGDVKPALVDLGQMLKRLGARSFDIIGNPEDQDRQA